MKPAARIATASTIAPSSQLLGRTTRMSGRSAANTATSTPIVRVRSAPRRAGRSSEGMAHPPLGGARPCDGEIAVGIDRPRCASRGRRRARASRRRARPRAASASVLWWATGAMISASAGSNRPTMRTTGPVMTPANTRTSLPRWSSRRAVRVANWLTQALDLGHVAAVDALREQRAVGVDHLDGVAVVHESGRRPTRTPTRRPRTRDRRPAPASPRARTAARRGRSRPSPRAWTPAPPAAP